jgi:hypothetical protein
MAYLTYDGCLYLCLAVTCVVAVTLFTMSFKPTFSLASLCNALLLGTAWVPLATNTLDTARQVGLALWLANLVCFLWLLAGASVRTAGRVVWRVLVSLLGLASFALHVFVVSAVP